VVRSDSEVCGVRGLGMYVDNAVDSVGRAGTGPCRRERPPGVPRSCSPLPYSR